MRYVIEKCVVDTKNATAEYAETRVRGNDGYYSLATNSPVDSETLYRSRRGRYYKVCWSRLTGVSHAEWLSPEAAVRWFRRNNLLVPVDLLSVVVRGV